VGSQRDAYSLTGSRRNREKSSGIRGDNVRGAALASTVLLQFRVLRLGLLQDGDVGVCVFPEGEKRLDGEFESRYCGSPTFCTNSTKRASERKGSSKKSVFKPMSSQSRSR
jgi:hypothetical protein